MSVFQAYKSLNSEQKSILETKQATMNRKVDDIIATLKPLAHMDRLGDKTRTKLGCGAALSIPLAIVFLIMWGNGILPAFVALILLVAVIGGGIYLGRLYVWLRDLDLSNNLRGFAIPVLTLFREDIDEKEPIQVKLDLRPPTCDAKKTRESEPYASGIYHKVIDKFYDDPWMSGDATLADGSHLHWSIRDLIREREKTKKNPRGKYKTKTKIAKKTQLDVEVTMKKKAYDLDMSALNADAESEVKQGERKNTVRISRQLKTDSLDPVNPRAFIDLVANVYRSARPAK